MGKVTLSFLHKDQIKQQQQQQGGSRLCLQVSTLEGRRGAGGWAYTFSPPTHHHQSVGVLTRPLGGWNKSPVWMDKTADLCRGQEVKKPSLVKKTQLN